MSEQQVDYETIHKLLEGNITNIKPVLNKGKVNRIYVVDVDNKSVVVRLNEATELYRFKKEQWCIDKATELGIPSPQVIDIGIIDNTAFMLLNFINGLNGDEIIENKSYIWKMLGSYAKKIHSISTKGFGDKMVEEGIFNDTWERYLTYNIDSLNNTDKLLTMEVITNEQSQNLLERVKALQQKQFKVGLTHGDLALANIIVEGNSITLIDWGSAESTIIPHFEIIGIFEDSLQEEETLFKDFLNGYGISIEEFEDMKSDIISLTLLRAVDKLRWAIDRKPELIEESSTKVKDFIAKFL